MLTPVALFFDARRLERADRELYRERIGTVPVWLWVLGSVLLLPLVTGVYIYRRNRFLGDLKLRGDASGLASQAPEKDPQWDFLIGTTQVFLLFGIAYSLVQIAFPLVWILGMTGWVGLAQLSHETEALAGEEFLLLIGSFLLVQIVFLGCIAAAARRYGPWSFALATGIGPADRHGLPGVVLGVLLGGVLGAIGGLLSVGKWAWLANLAMLVREPEASETFLLVVMGLALLVAPILQQPILQGFFYRIAETSRGQAFAFLLTVWAFWMLDLPNYIETWTGLTLLLGLSALLAGLRVWTGSVRASILAHISFNAAGLGIVPLALFLNLPLGVEGENRIEALPEEVQADFVVDRARRQPEDPQYLVAAARRMRDVDNLLVAEQMLEKASELVPDDSETRQLHAEVLWRLGHHERARALADALVREFPESLAFRETRAQLDVSPPGAEAYPRQRMANAVAEMDRWLARGDLENALAAYTVAQTFDAMAPRPLDLPRTARPNLALQRLHDFAVAHPVSGKSQPLVRESPVYPWKAQREGIEGWVHLRFTISAEGWVEDAVIVDAQPPGYFEEAALSAVRRYRYRPRAEDGVRQAEPGAQLVLSFDLE